MIALLLVVSGALPARTSTANASAHSSAAVATASSASVAPSQLPPGIPVEEAKAIAAPHASLNATFSKAESGLYRDFPPELQDPTIDPNRAVWAITYDSVGSPCYPGGNVCESPRHGTLTVFLDYQTGEFLESVGYFPKP